MDLSKESTRIRRMFADISRRYDLLNHVLSLNVDRRWRRKTVRALRLGPQDLVLDVCTGTGDLAFELAKGAKGRARRQVVGTDFCYEMVAIGEAKRRRRGCGDVTLMVADTLRLPFPDESFDAVTVAFGIRNVCDLEGGLREMRRVLKAGGKLAVLEFTTPRHALFRRLFHFYFHRLLPRVGRVLSGHPAGGEAYSYLPASVAEFPGAREFARLIEDMGFEDVRHRLLSWGIAALHLGRRGGAGGDRKEEE